LMPRQDTQKAQNLTQRTTYKQINEYINK
jgi:hypothetical protein